MLRWQAREVGLEQRLADFIFQWVLCVDLTLFKEDLLKLFCLCEDDTGCAKEMSTDYARWVLAKPMDHSVGDLLVRVLFYPLHQSEVVHNRGGRSIEYSTLRLQLSLLPKVAYYITPWQTTLQEHDYLIR